MEEAPYKSANEGGHGLDKVHEHLNWVKMMRSQSKEEFNCGKDSNGQHGRK